MKCDLTPATPRASTSQVPSEGQVDPTHVSLELQYAELKLNCDSLAITKESLMVSEQHLEVDCVMVSMLCDLAGVVRQVGLGSPL